MNYFETLNETAELFLKLWCAMLPDCPPPDHSQFLRWAGNFEPEVVGKGISRAAAKVRLTANTQRPMSSDDAARYATSVMAKERQHNQQQTSAVTPVRRYSAA